MAAVESIPAGDRLNPAGVAPHREAGGRSSGGLNLPGSRRLRLLGIGLPVLLILAFEAIRALWLETVVSAPVEHVIGGAVTAVGSAAFGIAMFLLIERGHRQILRRNRELAAVNSVSMALQGELQLEHVIDAALRSVIHSTGASAASVTIFAGTGDAAAGDGLTRRVSTATVPATDQRDATSRADAVRVDRAVFAPERLIDIPLSTGPTVVGRMRLHLTDDVADPDLLASNALGNIGHQLASAVQTTQLLADLQRRRAEGHAFYNVLLQISSQHALADTLATIVRGARDLLGADECTIVLSASVSRSLEQGTVDTALEPLGDGAHCVTVNREHFRNAHRDADVCPVRASSEFAEVLETPLVSPEGSMGDIWVGRRRGAAFTARDREFLITLARLTAIAISSTRLREGERQAAVLAERDRIAREMHDSLAQVLGMTHLRLRALAGRGEVAELPRVRTELLELADVNHEAFADVREAILGLRESSRLRGLTQSLQVYLARYSHQAGIRASLEAPLEEPQLTANSELQVIRVIQEALTNVRKHARASEVVVRVIPVPDHESVAIEIEDNGKGFDLGRTLLDRDGGFGLHTMRERLEIVGGTLAIHSTPGVGTRVVARVPALRHPDPAVTPEPTLGR